MRQPRIIPHITVTYSCGCYADIPLYWKDAPTNSPGESHCLKHGKVVDVVSRVDSYSIRCDDCRMRPRYYGAARMSAFVAASRHSVRHAHRVRVLQGVELIQVVGATTRQLMLCEPPPF